MFYMIDEVVPMILMGPFIHLVLSSLNFFFHVFVVIEYSYIVCSTITFLC
jgi:hypothetical protein